MSPTNEEWRAELLRIYEEAYEKKHGRNPDDPGGAKVRRKPKLPAGGSGAAVAMDLDEYSRVD